MITHAGLAIVLLVIAAQAQDVPPPPKPDAIDPSLAPLLESLKQTLLSSGRVESNAMSANGSFRSWQQITSVVVDAPGCQARMHFDKSFNGGDPTDQARSLFFEAVDTAEALTEQEEHDRNRSRIGQSRSITYSDSVYGVYINDSGSFLLFASQAQASNAAEAVSRAAQICRARTVSLNAAGEPSLADTLHFIEDKLNDSGAVSYRSTYQAADGSSRGSVTPSFALAQAAADPATCRLRFDEKPGFSGNPYGDYRRVVPFQRVEKLEVLTEQEALNRGRPPNGGVYSTEPMIYRLSVVYQGGDVQALRFRDEEMAQRVAKAMVHAVELCGGGSKDPF